MIQLPFQTLSEFYSSITTGFRDCFELYLAGVFVTGASTTSYWLFD